MKRVDAMSNIWGSKIVIRVGHRRINFKTPSQTGDEKKVLKNILRLSMVEKSFFVQVPFLARSVNISLFQNPLTPLLIYAPNEVAGVVPVTRQMNTKY